MNNLMDLPMEVAEEIEKFSRHIATTTHNTRAVSVNVREGTITVLHTDSATKFVLKGIQFCCSTHFQLSVIHATITSLDDLLGGRGE